MHGSRWLVHREQAADVCLLLAKWRRTAEQLIQHGTETVDVGARVDGPDISVYLFWRCVAERSLSESGLGLVSLAVGECGDAKVGELHLALLAQQYIPELHVAMDDVLGLTVHLEAVCVVERRSELSGDVQNEVMWQQPLPSLEVAVQAKKVGAIDQLHNHERAIVLPGTSDRTDDVWVAKL